MSPSSHPDLPPSIVTIFGITGDLAQRHLLPALYMLTKQGLLNTKTRFVGISRNATDPAKVLTNLPGRLEEMGEQLDHDTLESMKQRLEMLQLDPGYPGGYKDLFHRLNELETELGACLNRLFYLSIPPQVFQTVVAMMGQIGLNGSCVHGKAEFRILIEKPFGYDSTSARGLIEEVHKVFQESAIFRIDHYLAKETVQNILTFRFQNPIFEALWSREHIESIEISASEQIGILKRASFYEPLGALRDFIQSHLLQLLAVVTMDQPTTLDSSHVHANKLAVLKQVVPVDMSSKSPTAVRAQYEGYRDEVSNPSSVTETFAAIKIGIDSYRWQGVPITVWTGKALSERMTEVLITFNRSDAKGKNSLVFRIQPDEGISISLLAKKPGYDSEVQPVKMDFSYGLNFSNQGHPNAYERVLVDAIRGDHTLFATDGEVLEAWRIVQPVLDAWSEPISELQTYDSSVSGRELLGKLGI